MRVYEMQWDCPYCGTKKLLGKTQRFCPGCGAPQDPAKRYFPVEEDKVAVEDHEYVGADRLCGACGSPMAAKAQHCTQCGSPLDGAKEVRRVQEAAAAPQAAAAIPKRALSAGCVVGCLGLLGLGGILFLVTMLWNREVEARVVGHSWERSIAVERFEARQESAWCDELPSGAYGVSRSREVRSEREVPAGEDCQRVRVDQGDGTFREEQRCTPRVRKEPVYAEKCRFTIDRWVAARTEKTAGSGLAPAPAWPTLSLRAGQCRGCEREGERRQSYRVQLSSDAGGRFECTFDEPRWRTFTEGARFKMKVGVLTGAAACGSLKAQ
jgi:hypothetical protein